MNIVSRDSQWASDTGALLSNSAKTIGINEPGSKKYVAAQDFAFRGDVFSQDGQPPLPALYVRKGDLVIATRITVGANGFFKHSMMRITTQDSSGTHYYKVPVRYLLPYMPAKPTATINGSFA